MKAKKALSKREARKNVVRIKEINPESAAKRDTMRGAARRNRGVGKSLDEHRDTSVALEPVEECHEEIITQVLDDLLEEGVL